MFVVVCCWWLHATCCELCVVVCCWSLTVVGCSLRRINCSLCVAVLCWLLFDSGVCCVFMVGCCLLCIVCFVLRRRLLMVAGCNELCAVIVC